MTMTEWHQIGIVGVDAGCILLADPCYVLPGAPGRGPQLEYFRDICDDVDERGLTREIGGGVAVVVASGLGDGSYPVEVRYEDVPGWGRRVAEVRICFLARERRRCRR